MAPEVLTLHITLTEQIRVEGGQGCSNMLTFTGTAEGPYFHGTILSGGVDTQILRGNHLTLSARYTLEGIDAEGKPCRLFIENNGATDDVTAPMTTTPMLLTDSSALRWLEAASLYGTLEPEGPNRVKIHLFLS